MARMCRVCKVDEVSVDTMKSFGVNGRRILLSNVSGTIYAIDNECPHMGGELDGGDLEGDTVVCPIHYSRFSVVTGKVLEGPSEEDVATFKVKVEDGEIFVQEP